MTRFTIKETLSIIFTQVTLVLFLMGFKVPAAFLPSFLGFALGLTYASVCFLCRQLKDGKGFNMREIHSTTALSGLFACAIYVGILEENTTAAFLCLVMSGYPAYVLLQEAMYKEKTKY